MAFTSQFSLSLELTRLLPVRSITDKATQAFMDYARQLNDSGSDTIVEEDLVQVLGRSKISTALGSSFKTLVAKSSSSVSLVEGIMLQAGPGPTVARALRETPYFAMVVQLSLLVWSYTKEDAATALADAMQKRMEGATSASSVPNVPSREGILGVLQACETQTSAFNWNMLLQAVAKSLECSTTWPRGSLPTTIIHGALDMFPLVQSLPQDRTIYIRLPKNFSETDSVTCFLVVWIHQVLDLTVAVRRIGSPESKERTVRFGRGSSEQVVIEEVAEYETESITLLDSLGESLLDIKPDPDMHDTSIQRIDKVPARGWGNVIILSFLRHAAYIITEEKAVIEEIQIMASVFSQIIAYHLFHEHTKGQSQFREHEDRPSLFRKNTANIPANVDQYKLLGASRFLFDNPHISQEAINSYLPYYTSKAFNSNLPLPTMFQESSRKRGLSDSDIKSGWKALFAHLRCLSIYTIAFAHVLNLEDCGDLTFSGAAVMEISKHALMKQLESWNGDDNLYVRDDAWLQAIAVLLLGYRNEAWNLPWDQVCLVSDRGWSAWIPIFGHEDPAYVKPGYLFIGRGSPCRNGVWKSGVWDLRSGTWDAERPHLDGTQRAEVSGQQASLRCAQDVTFRRPFCGEDRNAFLVYACLKYLYKPREYRLYRKGYRELHKALWAAQVLSKCHHNVHSASITLPSGCATLEGSGVSIKSFLGCEEKTLVSLTADSVGARYLALVALHVGSSSYSPIYRTDEKGPSHYRNSLLRSNDCCFQCAIDQAALKPGKSVLVL